MIGVFMSAIFPGRVGEAGRAIVLARRLGRVSRHLPVVVGTLFSQTLLNVLGLFAVAAIAFASTPALEAHAGALALVAIVPSVLLALVLLAPSIMERVSIRSPVLKKAASALALRLTELRRGLRVFRRVSTTSHALSAQLAAWALQLASLYALFVAFRLQDQAGLAAAAAVLTAVNVAGILPLTPSNVGIFQAACVLVLAAWGISTHTALAYGLLLQAIEVAVALAFGLPALAGEHLSFRELHKRAEQGHAGAQTG
jgi:phosphatidylinositol alpha-mannosyltransferase